MTNDKWWRRSLLAVRGRPGRPGSGGPIAARPAKANSYHLTGCLRDDFLRRLITQTLEFVPTSPAPCIVALTKALAPIPIPGFRQFPRAPRGLHVRAAIFRFRESSAFVGRVLEAWLEAHRPLAALGEAFLDTEGIPRERIRAENEQFRDRWSLDEVLQLADRFCATHPADRDDVALLLCCLTSRAPVADSPAATGVDVPPDAATASPVPVQGDTP